MCRFNSLYVLTISDAGDSLIHWFVRISVAIFMTMSAMNVEKRMATMALCVSAFVFFAFGNGVRIAEGSCGDYLNHSRSSKKSIFSELRNDSLPTPVCQSGNCRSAPSLPPAEPSRVVLIRRHPSDFHPILTFFFSPRVRVFEVFDEELPSSVTLEVLTPPPLLTA